MNRALLVGINLYPAPNRLHGCVNDVEDMAGFLVSSCGFSHDDIRLLTDERATTAAIRERLQTLVAGLNPGDRVLFHYSGHGSQLPRRDAQGHVVENHDVICPVDFDFTPEHALSDTDFQALFKGIPSGVEFNWISDSCHSGDLTRLVERPGAKVKSYSLPADIAWRIETAQAKKLQAPGFAKAIEHLNGAFISGCRSDQLSTDAVIDGRPNGALTYYLLDVLESGRNLSLPLTQIVDATVAALSQHGYDQVPQLRGTPQILARSFLDAGKGAGAEPRSRKRKSRDGSVSVSAGTGPGGPVVSGTVTVHF